eukprot:gene27654-7292_t
MPEVKRNLRGSLVKVKKELVSEPESGQEEESFPSTEEEEEFGCVDELNVWMDEAEAVEAWEVGPRGIRSKRKWSDIRGTSVEEIGTEGSLRLERQMSAAITPTQEAVPILHEELRTHHLRGIKDMRCLNMGGYNTINFDELEEDRQMQAIGMLAHMRSEGAKDPFVIVVMDSNAIPGWQHQLSRLLPDCPVHVAKASNECNWRAKLDEACSPPRHRMGPYGARAWVPPVVIMPYKLLTEGMPGGECMGPLSNVIDRFQYMVLDACPTGRKCPPNSRHCEVWCEHLYKTLELILESKHKKKAVAGRLAILTTHSVVNSQHWEKIWPKALEVLIPKLIMPFLSSQPGDWSPCPYESEMAEAIVSILALHRTARAVDLNAPRMTLCVNLYDYFSPSK